MKLQPSQNIIFGLNRDFMAESRRENVKWCKRKFIFSLMDRFIAVIKRARGCLNYYQGAIGNDY